MPYHLRPDWKKDGDYHYIKPSVGQKSSELLKQLKKNARRHDMKTDIFMYGEHKTSVKISNNDFVLWLAACKKKQTPNKVEQVNKLKPTTYKKHTMPYHLRSWVEVEGGTSYLLRVSSREKLNMAIKKLRENAVRNQMDGHIFQRSDDYQHVCISEHDFGLWQFKCRKLELETETNNENSENTIVRSARNF